jgi:hypothetical protein
MVENLLQIKNLKYSHVFLKNSKVTETKFCKLPRNSAKVNGIPQHGIPYTSAEFLLIPNRIRISYR